MAQDFTLGRAGLATSAGGDGLELHADSWSQDGDRAAVSGVIRGRDLSSLADVKALRDQLSGYGPENTDEPVVPVTWAQDSSRDGFYRVLGVDVGSELSGRLRAGADGAELAVPWSAELVRVPGYQAPLVEVTTSGALRSNTHSITNGVVSSWVGWPGSSKDRSVTGSSLALVGGGTIAFSETSTSYFDSSVTFGVAASSSYEGAATLTMNSRTVVGRQVEVDGDGWVISNGLVKVRPSLTEANHFVIGVRNTGGTDYDEKSYRLGAYTGGNPWELGYDGTTRTGPVGVTVLRNSPEAVVLRLTLSPGSSRRFDGGDYVTGAWQPFYFDIAVRRGQFYADCTYSVRTGASVHLGVWRATTDAGTSITGGIEDNADDAASNKWQIYTPSAVTKDTTNGGLYLTAAALVLPFALGNDNTVHSGTTFSEAYFAAMNHRQQIAAR